MSRCSFFLLSVLFFSFLFSPNLQADPKRLREPSSKKTPCGFYLASMAHDTNGERIADFEPEALREAIRANPSSFKPRITYVHKQNGRAFTSAKDLEAAFSEGLAKPMIDFPVLAIVGAPILGSESKSYRKMAEEILKEEGVEHYALVVLNRPVKPEWGGLAYVRPALWLGENLHHGFQTLVYQFPLFGADKQTPQLAEIQSMKGKLMTANTVQQAALYSQVFLPLSPEGALTFSVATTAGLINYTNSYYTGKYRKFLSNWFNRSRNEGERLGKNVILSTFFIVEMHLFKTIVSPVFDFVMRFPESKNEWALYLPMDFLDLMTQGSAWKELLIAKWFSGVTNIGWRYYYYKAIHSFERRLESEGRVDDARRTAARFEWFGTALATPAFLYSVFVPKDAGYSFEIMGQHIAQLNYGHAVMAGVGLMFAAFHAGIFKMDPWVERFDRIHEGSKGIASKVGRGIRCIGNLCMGSTREMAGYLGLTNLVDGLERLARSPFEKNYEVDRVQELEGAQGDDIGNLMELDPKISDLVSTDPQLQNLIRRDPKARKLVESDKRFQKVETEDQN